MKFLDVRTTLSVQVHPSDAYKELIPPGDTGKTEAWVVPEAGPGARIYADLKPGADPDVVRQAKSAGSVGQLHPEAWRCCSSTGWNRALIEHWDHLDPKTGKGRPLQVEQAIAGRNRHMFVAIAWHHALTGDCAAGSVVRS